jgi:cytidine deaminase
MIVAMLCQLCASTLRSAAEFRLDIEIESYYATFGFRQIATMPRQPSNRNARIRLLEAARAAMKNAYAPYSKFRVGAALLTSRGEIVAGCNVENASYGVTNCAERTAIFSAVTKFGPGMRIQAIAVVSARNEPCSPCGACRQVIHEFGPKATVYFRGARGWKAQRIGRLLPEGFRFQ